MAVSKWQRFWIKLRNWEYWPSQAFYYPLIPHFLWQALRAGHPAFFTATNPAIFTGGFGFESKYDTMVQIPAQYRPKTVLLPPSISIQEALSIIEAAAIEFPLILKPDLGFRGFLVQKVASPEVLATILEQLDIAFLAQELVLAKEEFGVFYHRFPGQASGRITSLTLKTFLEVVGDGQATVQQLMEADQRALLQLDRIQEQAPDLLTKVPQKGARIPLGMIGNHSKGTRFINGNHLIDQELTRTFDRICDQMPGICYGRFDIKCDSFEQLKQGTGIKILEINGTCSEPTHIYDQTKGTYWSALRDFAAHWTLVRKIAVANHRLGAPYLPAMRMIRTIREGFAYFRKIAELQK